MVGESYTGRNTACPDPERWLPFVCGLESADANLVLAAHAAQCDRCALLLREALEIASDTESPSEREFLRNLKTSEPLWRKSQARNVAPTSPIKRAARWRSWGAIAASILALVGGTVFWLYYQANQAPLGELAEAYTQHRSIELRIPNAKYSPVNVERGSSRTRSPELLTAEASIERHLASHSEDWQWLHAKGRAELLEWNFDAAIHELSLASDLAPSNHGKRYAELRVDLATAYFERAEVVQRPIDYRAAIEDLSKAIQADPSLAAAYFNRALVFEKVPDYFHAVEDWKKYLTLEPSGGWADEARRSLAAATKKISDLRAEDPNRLAELLEPQLEAIMASGLKDRRQAGQVAARLLRENGDHWLTDTLVINRDAMFVSLGPIAESRSHLRISQFPHEMTRLKIWQKSEKQSPVSVWLTFELLFRATHAGGPPAEPANLGSAMALAKARGYWWLFAQFLMETASLRSGTGNWGQATALVSTAQAVAHEHHFPLLEMRAAGFEENQLANNGQYRSAADISHKELLRFWQHPHPWLRAQTYYANMAWAEEGLGRMNTAMFCAETSAHFAQLAGAIETQAVNLARTASFAQAAGDSRRASAALTLSRSIFSKLPQNAGTDVYRAFSESEYSLESDDDGHIAQFESIVRASANPWVRSPYLRALALSDLRRGRLLSAEKRLSEAISLLVPHAELSAREYRTWRMEIGRNYRELVSTLLDQRRTAEAFGVWQQYLLAEARLLNAPVTSLENHGSVHRDVLTFARLQNRYGVWHSTPATLEFVWLTPNADAIDLLIRRYASLCANPTAGLAQIKAVGSDLASAFSPVLYRAAANGTLLIQPDGELARVAWLSLPISANSRLVDKTIVDVTPLPLGVAYPARPLDLNHTLAIGADVVSEARATELQPLPDISAELETVRSAAPACTVLHGRDATPRNIAGHLADASLLHFAGHSLTTADGVALVVAPEEGVDTWYPDPRVCSRLALAIFSTCSAARYEDVQAAAPQNLAHAFLLSGTPQVLAALWNVDSRATAFFMRNFYSGLLAGLTADAAAQSAALSVRRQPGWAHPYYWASFVLFAR